jgi:hypothetical protein
MNVNMWLSLEDAKELYSFIGMVIEEAEAKKGGGQ